MLRGSCESGFEDRVGAGGPMVLGVSFCDSVGGRTRVNGVAVVDGQVVCEATMLCARSREA